MDHKAKNTNDSGGFVCTYLIPALITIILGPYAGSVLFLSFQGASFRGLLLAMPVWAPFMDLIMFPCTLLFSFVEIALIRYYLRYRGGNLRLAVAARDFLLAGGVLGALLAFLWPGLTFLLPPSADSWENIRHLLISGLITGSSFGLLFSLPVYLGNRKVQGTRGSTKTAGSP